MGKPKKYDRRTINFGDRNNPARIIVEDYVKKNGNNELSLLIRKLVIFYFINDPRYEDAKKRMLLGRKQEIVDRFLLIQKELQQINKELEDKGIDTDW